MQKDLGKITILGTKKEVEEAVKILKTVPDLNEIPEAEARLYIQDAIDSHNLKATIMYDGNTVWSRKRILRNLRRIIKAGVLGYAGYTPIGSMLRIPSMERGKMILSDYFYKFLCLQCGSIAHYNKAGWVAEYHTVEDLRDFFLGNELGKRVSEYIPSWKTDAKRIVADIEKELKIT